MRRSHDMPFGASFSKDRTRFRLWAPGCDKVSLCLQAGEQERSLPMASQAEGWFERVVPDVQTGTLYRFEVNDGLRVPDPASRFNPNDVHGRSEVVDPQVFDWQDGDWHGRPWEEAVIYELHTGTFSPPGTFAGIKDRLDYLLELGVTAIELMPVADFPGARNWGYDGVLPFAPDSRYGRPEELKALVQAAHAKGLMVLLDVVYNHFGAEGNYLWLYAQEFFSPSHRTPWGNAINFDGPDSRVVREFFIQNALYWLHEYHLDGLRLDAVHAIIDDSGKHFLIELAERVHATIAPGRHVHLVLENDANEARYLASGHYAAQWNDDIHHALHVITSGEVDGYYADYADQSLRRLGRCLTEGFGYQGEASGYRDNTRRGEDSRHLPAQCFVSFIQSHDQVGNRAFGERLHHIAPQAAVEAAVAIFLLAPSIPMLFMGEEFAARAPFLFFCDFGKELRDAVSQGRRNEFSRFQRFADPWVQAAIPDPNDEKTFLISKLDWGSLNGSTHAAWFKYYRHLMRLRREVLVPRLPGMAGNSSEFRIGTGNGLSVVWRLGDGCLWHLAANLSATVIGIDHPPGEVVFATSTKSPTGVLGPWSLIWSLETPAV